jgi:AraC-like DNA-binding protein
MKSFIDSWSSDDLPALDRYAAWTSMLNATYGRWEVDKAKQADFFGTVERYDDDTLKVIECVCDPCSAKRTRASIRADRQETLTLQVVLNGKENIDFDGELITLNRGDLLVWDSTKPMSFEVEKRLHKISVMLPLERFQAWLPRSWCSIRHSINGDTANGRMLGSHVKALRMSVFNGGCNDSYALIDATIGVLVNALDGRVGNAPRPVRITQLRIVKEHINANIRNPALSPSMIARSCSISLRYLHWLFKFSGETVNQYIIRKRLDFCARDLLNPNMKSRKISDIAFFWGFQDSTHFSKRFRQQYLKSAKTFREQLEL